MKKKEVLFHTFNLERIFSSWNKLRNSIYASFIFLYLFFYFCEGYTTKSSNIRMCIQGQNELFCLLFYFCYIFIDLLTFYSLIVRFCNIFSWTFYCCGSVYPAVSVVVAPDTTFNNWTLGCMTFTEIKMKTFFFFLIKKSRLNFLIIPDKKNTFQIKRAE